jgi:hypothetical protein
VHTEEAPKLGLLISNTGQQILFGRTRHAWGSAFAQSNSAARDLEQCS